MIPALATDRLTVIRGTRALLREVTLEVRTGEVLALVGPNGAGKSTLLGCLAGDIDPDGGTVFMQGEPLDRIPLAQRARRRAVLPQQALLQFAFSAREVVAMGRTPVPPTSREVDEAVISRSLASTEMEHMADRVFPRLSGGEQHRVSLARVLAQETPILLLDEPTAALDIRHQHLVMATARGLAESGGTVLAILHDLNLAATYADRIGVLHDGALVACDAPASIAREDLLSEVFDFPITIQAGVLADRPLIVPRPFQVDALDQIVR